MSTDTEFICQVVEVAEVLPHPNADRLEIAHIRGPDGPMAYTTVVQKGTFRPGDPAVYVGVDSLVPRGTPGCDFLFQRQDGRNKAVFRVRAARLRGVYSEGFLLPVSSVFRDGEGVTLGDDVSARLGITYHQPPPERASTAKSPFPRVKDPTMGGAFPIYTIDSLRKVPWLFQDGEPVIYTEKIHGTNFRAGLPGGKWVVGSHRTVKTDLRGFWRRVWDFLRGRRHKNGGFYEEDLWTRASALLDLKARMEAHGLWDYVLYGELFGVTPEGKRIQALTYGDTEMGLRLFDVWDCKARAWLPWQSMVNVAFMLGLDVVPILEAGPYSLGKAKELAEGPSTLYPYHIREGVVVRPLFDHRRGKWVGEGYRLMNQAALNPPRLKEAA